MKKISLVILMSFFLLNTINTTAQNTTRFSKLIRYQPDSAKTMGIIVALTYDSMANRIYFGLENTMMSGVYWLTKPVLYKMDADGNILKERYDSIGGVGFYSTVVQSNDKRYLYWAGMAYDTAANIDTSHITADFMVTKTDTNLNRIWRKRYKTQGIRNSFTEAIKENQDGTLMVLGVEWTDYNDSVYPASSHKTYLLKIDTSGDLLWKRQTGPSYSHVSYGMAQSDDGNYLLAGQTYSWGHTSSGAPFVLKADTAGTELWHKTYLPYNYTTWLMGIIRTKDIIGSYVNFGITVPIHNVINGYGTGYAYLNKIDASGNLIWESVLDKNIYPESQFWAATSAGKGDFLGVGSSEGELFNYTKGLLVRYNKDGNIKWSREIQPDTSVIPYAYLYNVVALKDGSFVAVGSGDGYGDLSTNSPTQAGWVVRVDSNGCLSADCQNLGISPVAVGSPAAVQVFPNPTKGRITIKSEKPFSKETSIVLLDRLGRNLESFTAPAGQTTVSYDLKGLAPGIYFLEINQNDQKIIREVNLLR